MTKRKLQEKHGTFTHNHAVSPAAFAAYPTSHGLKDPIVSARVDGMLAVGAKRSRIYDYLLEHDQNVIQVDVDSLVRGHASSVSNIDGIEATAREIAAFAAADSESMSTVAETKLGKLGLFH
ncbi:hypothetical protein GN958_ATG02745 [Phytophthora infestans]|uniref:Uncharacterized protein n=1 Tax=Phytophthora infestans TaxID=4787 RepID=A0A8S9V5D0_PHYIN|nr:hypothetical protein GN958_ATG02745 [Phytophthora infestans]